MTRLIKLDEVSLVAPILEGFREEVQPGDAPDTDYVIAYLEKLVAAGTAYLIGGFTEDGELVGVLACISFPGLFTKQVMLDELFFFVLKEHRGKIGKELMNAYEGLARILGVGKVSLVRLSDEKMKPKVVDRFYKRAGYVELETKFVKTLD